MGCNTVRCKCIVTLLGLLGFHRVFYVTAVDKEGDAFHKSPGPGFGAEVTLQQKSGKWDKLKLQWFDLGDGSFMGLFFFNVIPEQVVIKVGQRCTRVLFGVK